MCAGVCAQSGDNRYASRMTQDGTIFFIMPHGLGKTDGLKKFDYDVTLLSWTDSVTVNFTFISKDMYTPTHFLIRSGDKDYKCSQYSPLFIDLKKDMYEIRITSKFSVADFKSMIFCPYSPVFLFDQNGLQKSASYKQGAWHKDSKKLQDIFRIYEYIKLK